MELSFTNADEWYEVYKSAFLNRRYEILMETLDQTLSEDFIEEVALDECLLIMLDELTNRNLIDQFLAFTDKFQTKQPDLYKKEYPYFDNPLVKYYLYLSDREKVAESLARFMDDPVRGIDYMTVMLDYLQFYEYTDVAVELCQSTYLFVMGSVELIPGAEHKLGYLMFVDMIEKAYRRIRSGEAVDWEALIKEAEKYGYGGGAENAADIRDSLTGELEGGEAFIASFKQNREESISALAWAFMKNMLDQKDMAFICSNHIFDGMLSFLTKRKLRSNESVSPNTYFAFSKNEFDKYLGQMIGGFMSMQRANAVGILWGIVYIYDFLLSKELIVNSVHRNIMESVDLLKSYVIKAFGRSLWKYDFVHRWAPPDSISNDDFAAESELFSKTIENQKPLGDERPRDPMDMFRQPVDADLSPEPVRRTPPVKIPITGKKPPKKKHGTPKLSRKKRKKRKK